MKQLFLISSILGFLITVDANAQTVVNPNGIRFTPSPEHALLISGVPVIDHYEVNTMIGTVTGAISFTKSIGKPSPVNNVIEVTLVEFNNLPRGTFVSTVSSVGPSGNTTMSDPTDPFVSTGNPAPVPGKPVPIRK